MLVHLGNIVVRLVYSQSRSKTAVRVIDVGWTFLLPDHMIQVSPHSSDPILLRCLDVAVALGLGIPEGRRY